MNKVLIPLLSLGGVLAMSSAFAADGETLYKTKACAACHAIDTKMVGPSFAEVAERYAEQENAVAVLMASIVNGSQGKWGPVPMSPNAVTEEEAKILVKWILQQN